MQPHGQKLAAVLAHLIETEARRNGTAPDILGVTDGKLFHTQAKNSRPGPPGCADIRAVLGDHLEPHFRPVPPLRRLMRVQTDARLSVAISSTSPSETSSPGISQTAARES